MQNQAIKAMLPKFSEVYKNPRSPYFSDVGSMLKAFAAHKKCLDTLLINKEEELVKINVVLNTKMQQRLKLNMPSNTASLAPIIPDESLLKLAQQFGKIRTPFSLQSIATGLSLKLLEGKRPQPYKEGKRDAFTGFFMCFYVGMLKERATIHGKSLIMEGIVRDKTLKSIDAMLIDIAECKALLDTNLVNKLIDGKKHNEAVNLKVGDISGLDIGAIIENKVKIQLDDELLSMQQKDKELDLFFATYWLATELMLDLLIGARLPQHSLAMLNFEFGVFKKRMMEYNSYSLNNS